MGFDGELLTEDTPQTVKTKQVVIDRDEILSWIENKSFPKDVLIYLAIRYDYGDQSEVNIADKEDWLSRWQVETDKKVIGFSEDDLDSAIAKLAKRELIGVKKPRNLQLTLNF